MNLKRERTSREREKKLEKGREEKKRERELLPREREKLKKQGGERVYIGRVRTGTEGRIIYRKRDYV